MTSRMKGLMNYMGASIRIGMVLGLSLAAGLVVEIAKADQPKPDTGKGPSPQSIKRAWEVSWSRFYRDDTHLFYDYLTSYEDGKELSHLPTADEVARQYPNVYESVK